ncbi:hypothetical protein FOXB_04153 [Fusarium oxysporum f. sp. conglutinans Fo5176]|uniref:Uncharacterized protein n=1 Tax=Fusarium oxysporum (strain Fo5176) TaxID=660025 RepID=F9FCM5_FUSOF|nr:hypothetical protein FOXB_04153 [Fusarium oxysporum f. sp. conglutinans Fo5176]
MLDTRRSTHTKDINGMRGPSGSIGTLTLPSTCHQDRPPYSQPLWPILLKATDVGALLAGLISLLIAVNIVVRQPSPSVGKKSSCVIE